MRISPGLQPARTAIARQRHEAARQAASVRIVKQLKPSHDPVVAAAIEQLTKAVEAISDVSASRQQAIALGADLPVTLPLFVFAPGLVNDIARALVHARGAGHDVDDVRVPQTGKPAAGAQGAGFQTSAGFVLARGA